MKKFVSIALAAVLTVGALFTFAGCGSNGITIAVPNDTTNEARALLLLQDAGLLTLGNYTGTPTTADITSSKVSLVEVNAGMTYQYVDDEEIAAAVVNGNYAASYGVDRSKVLLPPTAISSP